MIAVQHWLRSPRGLAPSMRARARVRCARLNAQNIASLVDALHL